MKEVLELCILVKQRMALVRRACKLSLETLLSGSDPIHAPCLYFPSDKRGTFPQLVTACVVSYVQPACRSLFDL